MDISRIKHLAGLTEATKPKKKYITISGKGKNIEVSITNTDKLEDLLAKAIQDSLQLYGGSMIDFSHEDIKNIIKSGKFTIQLK